MARASSVISVSIIGDAKKLISATKSADKATSGLLSSGAKVVGALAVGAIGVDKAFEFIGDSTREADRLGDAVFRLNTQIGKLAGPLEDTAGNFAKIGASRQDMIELEAQFADFATAAHIADPAIAGVAEQVAATATALSLVRNESPDELISLIAKAAGGSEKAARALGVSLIDTKDAGAQLTNILLQLKPALDDATSGSGDLEQKQRELQARIETLQGEIGEKLNPVLADLLTGLLAVASHDWAQDFGEIETGVRTLIAPLGNVRDLLENILGLFDQAKNSSATFHVNTTRITDRAVSDAIARERERNGLGR